MEIDLPEVVAEVTSRVRPLREGAGDERRRDARRAVPRRRRAPSATASARTSTATTRSRRSAPRARRSASTRTISQHRDHHLRPRFRGRLDAVSSRDACRARSAGRCRPGCAFRTAGAWSPRMSASSMRPARPDAPERLPARHPRLDIGGLHDAYARGLDPCTSSIACSRRSRRRTIPASSSRSPTARAVRKAAQKLGRFDPVAKPLWGIPFAVKDNIDVAGLPTTAACPAFAYTPKASATAVERAARGRRAADRQDQPRSVRHRPRRRAHALSGAAERLRSRLSCRADRAPGSAVAVALGLVPFALGTDTAGSGRVPAGLNNIVGLKPSVGAVSTSGVVPACRTLDCVSVFAGTVDDAWAVYEVIAGTDAGDPFSRPIALGRLGAVPPRLRHRRPGPPTSSSSATPRPKRPGAPPEDAEGLGAELVESTWPPSTRWRAALRGRLGGRALSAIAAVPRQARARGASRHAPHHREGQGLLRRRRLRRPLSPRSARGAPPSRRGAASTRWPCRPRRARRRCARSTPIRSGPNSRLGTYTNFVNLLDLAAIAVPGAMRKDGRAAGITLIGAARAGCGAGEPGSRLPRRGGGDDRRHRAAAAAAAAAARRRRAGRHARAGRGGRASVRHGAQPRAARAGGLFLRAVDTEPCLRALRAARRPAGAAGPRARRGGQRGTPSPPRCGRCRPRASAASSPASRRRSASARCCSPTAPGPRASCARARPSAPPSTSPLTAAGAPTSRPRSRGCAGIRRLPHSAGRGLALDPRRRTSPT